VGNLVINNTSPLAVAFPGAGRVTPKGLSGAVAVPVLLGNPAPMSGVAANAGLNGSIVFGPGALGGTFPGDRFTSAAAVKVAVLRVTELAGLEAVARRIDPAELKRLVLFVKVPDG
jgi:hypothetical protein